MSDPSLLSIATATPPYVLRQEEVVEAARTIFGDRFPGFERMIPVFESAGIRQRQSAMPLDWYLQPHDWPGRSDAYVAAAVVLFVEAAQRALEDAAVTAAEVDIIVTVSSTGVATPSLEARAMQAMGFRPNVGRVPVFGLGCAGGATGLALAARLARASPGATVLLVVVELCTLSFRTEGPLTKADIVATALFGDGAAACVVSSRDPGFARIVATAEHLWPDTLDIMGWRIDPEGLGVIFDRAIPPFARAHLCPAMTGILSAQELEFDDIDRFVCHPGGTKVVEALELSLSLPQGSLDHERAVLRDHGNMSAPTVLHVLDRVRKDAMPARSVVSALGPGFTLSTLTLEAA